jgi:hypothetical protein
VKDTSQIVVGANGSVRVAPTTADDPADISAEWSEDWIDLGFTSEDGVTFTDAKTLEAIPVWQLMYPARRVVTERDATAAFTLRQFAGPQVVFAFGGGEVTEDATGLYRYVPPDPEVIDERKLGLEWLDGDKTYRLILPRGMVTENVETQIVRTAAADLPITFGILGVDGEAPWYMLTDDPFFADEVAAP